MMPTKGRDDDASNEEQRRIRWEDKIGFHLEPEEFMEQSHRSIHLRVR
ncbi:unnamed protein product [Gulo gulo]|uniref:Uncharacterized protein n=1 Tax=Gulo gulo TaxID=48420 RepID=A0A9X9MA21_GULGU|nr:unnamed protein product [Gulo gulo]